MLGTAEFKVGLFVLICIGIIAAMSLQVNNNPAATGRAHHYNAIVTNASGLVKNSNVKMAGIPVGILKDIVLDDGKARLQMVIRADLPVNKDASVEIRPNGILGDKYIELHPGTPEAGSLDENGVIMKFVDNGSFDKVLDQVGKIASDIGTITENLKKATTGEGDDGSPIGRTIHHIEDLTADLRDIAHDNKEKIASTIDHIHSISKTIDQFVNDESEDGFKTNWKKMAKSLGRVDSILKNVDEVTGKINRGEGTLGKLVNDDKTIEELNHAIQGVNNMLDTASKFRVNIDYHVEDLAGGNFIKNYIGINIQPAPDRYYIVQVVDDPKGSYDRTDAQQTGPGGTTTTQTAFVYRNRLKFSAEFAKVFYDLTIRGGVIESTGGFGADYSPGFLKHKLSLSAELFGFERPEGVDLRAFVKYKFYSVFYAIFGGDDLINPGNSFTGTGASGFVGVGLDFTDDDLKLLLSKAPL
jgi:phospholipid/cholesterol/gamma-HCH transport system substrate-binding protein